MQVDVYRNLRKNTFSIRHKGKVIGHSNRILMTNCSFIVSQKGRERVLRERRKNVHAIIRGNLLSSDESSFTRLALWNNERASQVKYSPYLKPYFFTVLDGKPIESSREVFIKRDTVMAAVKN